MPFFQNKTALQTLLILACMFLSQSMQSDNISTVLSDAGGSGPELHQYLKQLPGYNPSFRGKTFADIPKGSDEPEVQNLLSYLEAAANAGDTNAQYRYSEYLLSKHDQDKALYHLFKAAKAGHPRSFDKIAKILLDYGTDTVVKQQILEQLDSLPDNNNLSLQTVKYLWDLKTDLSFKYDGIEYDENFSADNFPPIEKYYVGMHYLLNTNNHESAEHWLEEASKLGIPEASYHLAQIIISNNAANKNSEQTKRLLNYSAKRGYFPAIRDMGDMLSSDNEKSPDHVEALQYYQFGAARGDSYCRVRMANILEPVRYGLNFQNYC